MAEPILKKICSSCGKQKPLSAFLQLTGQQGTTYSNICADCRKANAEKVNESKQAEGSTRSTSGLKIDSKTKVHDEILDKKQQYETAERYKEEREKIEEEKEQHEQQKLVQEKDSKQHQKSFLGKSPYLTPSKTEDQKRFANFQQIEEGAKNEAIKEEDKKKEIDLSTGAYMPSQTGEIKQQSAAFLRFKKWVGMSAPVSRVLGPALQNAEQKAQQQTKEVKEVKEVKKDKTTKDQILDDIDNSFKHTRRR